MPRLRNHNPAIYRLSILWSHSPSIKDWYLKILNKMLPEWENKRNLCQFMQPILSSTQKYKTEIIELCYSLRVFNSKHCARFLSQRPNRRSLFLQCHQRALSFYCITCPGQSRQLGCFRAISVLWFSVFRGIQSLRGIFRTEEVSLKSWRSAR